MARTIAQHRPVAPHTEYTEYEERPFSASRPAIPRHEQIAGISFAAAFFGWLVAAGLTVILLSLFAALGIAAVNNVDVNIVANVTGETAQNIGVVSAVAVLVAVGVGYFAGGYVAGRMARFGGARQGAGVFAVGLIAMILLGILGATAGASLMRFIGLSVSLEVGTLTAAGIISALIALAVMLLSAVAGGKLGEDYPDTSESLS